MLSARLPGTDVLNVDAVVGQTATHAVLLLPHHARFRWLPLTWPAPIAARSGCLAANGTAAEAASFETMLSLSPQLVAAAVPQEAIQ